MSLNHNCKLGCHGRDGQSIERLREIHPVSVYLNRHWSLSRAEFTFRFSVSLFPSDAVKAVIGSRSWGPSNSSTWSAVSGEMFFDLIF